MLLELLKKKTDHSCAFTPVKFLASCANIKTWFSLRHNHKYKHKHKHAVAPVRTPTTKTIARVHEHVHIMCRIDNCQFSIPYLLDTEKQDGGLTVCFGLCLQHHVLTFHELKKNKNYYIACCYMYACTVCVLATVRLMLVPVPMSLSKPNIADL